MENGEWEPDPREVTCDHKDSTGMLSNIHDMCMHLYIGTIRGMVIFGCMIAQQQLITIGLGILLLENYMIHNVLLLDAVWSTTCQPNGELKINDTCSGLFGNIKVAQSCL